ncbi:MAG: 1-acyl-sn-glycerol-3-phosphate acyltransferase [Gammaproteobacteria bacterium]|nr:1-acyl-sn-glycerol-3-phosphate acyltransferase [Gammaproteobacteria bacterium]
MILWLRSLALLTIGGSAAIITSAIILLLFWAPATWSRFVLVSFCRFGLWAGDFFCGMKVVVEGRENIPDTPSVIMVKHTTILETYGHVPFFPKTAWVVKRELVWVPIIGWAIGLVLNPIAINRGRGRSAVKQVIEQGKQRLADGIWVTIFPEGTRVPFGETRKYGISGAALANAAGVQIVPVAHNAGDFWRRREFSMLPGTVRFCIGPPIDASNQTPKETNLIVQAWIEGKMREISSAYKK